MFVLTTFGNTAIPRQHLQNEKIALVGKDCTFIKREKNKGRLLKQKGIRQNCIVNGLLSKLLFSSTGRSVQFFTRNNYSIVYQYFAAKMTI